MFNFRRKIPRGKYFWSWPPVLLGLAVVAFFLVSSATRITYRYLGIRNEREAIDRKVRELRAEKERLEELIKHAESPQAVERLAKERLNLKKPEEEVVVVSPEKETSSPASGSVKTSTFVSGWVEALVNFFRRR